VAGVLTEQTAAVKEDIRKLGSIARDVAQEKIESARQAASEAIEHGRQRASEVFGQGREKASEILEQGKKKAGELEDQVVDYVRTKPIKSLLIAGGLGVLVGYFLSSRR